MRTVLVAALLLGCNHDHSEADQLRAQLAAQKQEIDSLKTRLTAPVQAPAAPTPASDYLAIQFAQMVKHDPVRFSRASGLKLNDIINEDGMVFDVERIADAVRDKTVRSYGKETAQRALVSNFGAEVGSAIFFGKIKNPN
jgi:hypothetical protein